MAKKSSGWSDESGEAFNNPFAALVPDKTSPPAPVVGASAPPPVAPEPDPPPVVDAPPKRAVVRLEKKGRGGKKVTLVTHLGLTPEGLERWCADLRRTLGCGGAVDGETIVLQGDQRERAAARLEARGVRRVTRS